MGTLLLDPMPVHDFQLQGAGVGTPELGGERTYIEQLRRITFGIGDGKASKMAEILHRTIQHVSTEIYQKDIHFLSELLQNAEDNEYPVGVTPSLHLVLTYNDICNVGAPATLVIFNNECGFTEGNVEALCNVGYSTKNKTRGKGYIGEKGIGFKSVFLVSSQPYVISNGFRIRLNENKDKQADVGFIVPEWVNDPSDEQLSQLFGVGLKLPATVILLPLKADKVAAVQQQIAQISPEILLFLSQIKELAIRDDRPGVTPRVIKVRRRFWPVIRQNELSTVELSVNGLQQESASYFCCSQKVPVTLPKDCCIEQRSEVKNWAITLGFPLEGRISGGTSGDVYSFLPTEHQSGLPCLLNADFILTSSRESIRFDSPWNNGIFEAIPQVFVTAFSIMVSKSIDGLLTEFLPIEPQSVYQFVPTKSSSHRYFKRLQESVTSALASTDVVLCFPKGTSKKPPVYRPVQCRRLSKKFCEILTHAAVRLACQVSDFISAECYIVDTEVQDKFGAQLDALGVVQFHANEYVTVLGPWILELQEDAYVKLLHFVASDLGPAASARLRTIPLLKYQEPGGSVGLASLSQAETLKKIKVPALRPCPWLPWLYKWIQEFSRWVPIYFLPMTTVHEILQLDAVRTETIWCWLRTFAKVTELSVKEYSHDLISHTPQDPGYFILVTQYLFSIEEQFPDDPSHVNLSSYLANKLPVVDIKNAAIFQVGNAWYSRKQVMLPGCSSHWPLLLPGDSWGGYLTKMHDDYMTPQSDLVKLSADALSRYSLFLRGHFCARDLLDIDPPNCPLPEMQQGGNITDRTVNLLLDWVQAVIRRGGKGRLTANGEFMASIQSFHWLPTLDHGDKRPTDVFWPSSAALEVFSRPSVPFLKPAFCDGSKHGDSLALVGLVVDVNLGHRAVVSLMNDLFDQPADSLPKDMILNIYEGVRRLQWDCSEIEAIWIPPFPGNNNVAHWVLVKDCVAYDEDGLFRNYFPAVLSETYDEGFLQFFVSKFHVQSEPTVEDYCLYWKLCMDEGRQLSYGDCKKVWGTIVNSYHMCEKKVWEDFVSTVDQVPAVEAGKKYEHSCELKQASQVFIPDRLEFADKFGRTPTGLWIPLYQATPENLQDLYTVYRFLGANMLSDCTEIRLTEVGKRCLAVRSKKTRGWICEGLFRAILGFLHGQGRSQVRQKWLSIVSALVDTSDIEMDSPVEIEYCLYPTKDERNEVLNTASGFRMVYWDKESECLFSVDHERSTSAAERTTIQLEFSHAIAEGLLAEYSRDLMEDMRNFLFAYTHVNFEVEVVNQMLRADNIQLSPQEEAFIASRFQISTRASGVACDAGLVDIVSTMLDQSITSRCMISHDIVDSPQSEAEVDVWSDAGVFCRMPPLAIDSLLGESFLDPLPSKKAFKLNAEAPPFMLNVWQENLSSSGDSKQMSLPAAVVGMMTACGRHDGMTDGGSLEGHGANLSAKGSSAGSSWSTIAASSYKHAGSHRKQQHDLKTVSVKCTNSWQPLVHLNEGDANDQDAHSHRIQVEGMDIRSDNQAAVDNVGDNGIGTNGQPVHSHIRVPNGLEVGLSDHTKASKPASSPDSRSFADSNIQERRSIYVREEGDLLGEQPLCGEDNGKLSNGHVDPGKSCNGSTKRQPRQGPSREGHLKAHPKGQSHGKVGKHLNVIRGAPTRNGEMNSESKSVSPSSSSFSPRSRGKEDGRCTTSTGDNGSCKQPKSMQSLSPSTCSESSRDYENERLQLFLEAVYESSGAQAAGTDEFSECLSVPTESESRFRYGARRIVFTLPALVGNAGEGDHVNGEQKHSPGHSRLQAAAVRGQKPHQFSTREVTLIKGWCMYRAPHSEEAKMAGAIQLPAETYESLDWWRKEHLPEVKKILGYTMAKHLSMKLGPREERCDIDSLLTLAFLHQKYPHANGASYQRLEFLGDACLGVAVATELFRQHPRLNEHSLTQLRSALVCNSTCALFFRSAHLDRHVITAVGNVSPEAVTDSIAADVFEAILGAGFLAHGKQGLLEVHRLVFEVFLPHLQASLSIVPDPL